MAFWSLTNSDFLTNQTFHQFHDIDTELDLYRLWVVSMEHLQRVWHASRERIPSGHLVPSPIVGLACAPIVETRFLELAMSLLDFSPRIPLGTFSILLCLFFFYLIDQILQQLMIFLFTNLLILTFDRNQGLPLEHLRPIETAARNAYTSNTRQVFDSNSALHSGSTFIFRI